MTTPPSGKALYLSYQVAKDTVDHIGRTLKKDISRYKPVDEKLPGEKKVQELLRRVEIFKYYQETIGAKKEDISKYLKAQKFCGSLRVKLSRCFGSLRKAKNEENEITKVIGKLTSDITALQDKIKKDGGKAPEAPKGKEEKPVEPKGKESEKAPEKPKAKEGEKAPEKPKGEESGKAPEAPKGEESGKAPEGPKGKEEKPESKPERSAPPLPPEAEATAPPPADAGKPEVVMTKEEIEKELAQEMNSLASLEKEPEAGKEKDKGKITFVKSKIQYFQNMLDGLDKPAKKSGTPVQKPSYTDAQIDKAVAHLQQSLNKAREGLAKAKDSKNTDAEELANKSIAHFTRELEKIQLLAKGQIKAKSAGEPKVEGLPVLSAAQKAHQLNDRAKGLIDKANTMLLFEKIIKQAGITSEILKDFQTKGNNWNALKKSKVQSEKEQAPAAKQAFDDAITKLEAGLNALIEVMVAENPEGYNLWAETPKAESKPEEQEKGPKLAPETRKTEKAPEDKSAPLEGDPASAYRNLIKEVTTSIATAKKSGVDFTTLNNLLKDFQKKVVAWNVINKTNPGSEEAKPALVAADEAALALGLELANVNSAPPKASTPPELPSEPPTLTRTPSGSKSGPSSPATPEPEAALGAPITVHTPGSAAAASTGALSTPPIEPPLTIEKKPTPPPSSKIQAQTGGTSMFEGMTIMVPPTVPPTTTKTEGSPTLTPTAPQPKTPPPSPRPVPPKREATLPKSEVPPLPPRPNAVNKDPTPQTQTPPAAPAPKPLKRSPTTANTPLLSGETKKSVVDKLKGFIRNPKPKPEK